MSELLPTIQATVIRASLVDYLTTTFALSDAEVRDSLDRFLSDPANGMFKGPYVRLRLPFQPATDGWRNLLEWAGDITPYGHQAAAFARLASLTKGEPRRPLPTLVTTGTGSGKTEAFLYPILDHVQRARREGVAGTKALILYPMNALANDQSQRVAGLITGHRELAGVTAALYTGEQGKPRTSVTPEGLISDRAIIRDNPPDILLTNYKMLDQLLLRGEDQEIWRRSALSLQYLVLDEFHTYDGAQGTDVAMLLRRLGLALKSYWPTDGAGVDAEDYTRPLGRITPVATSATLGDKGDPLAMLEFAATVFGEPFGTDAVVTESRQSLDEWIGDAPPRAAGLGLTPIEPSRLDVVGAAAALDELGSDPRGDELASRVLRFLYDGPLPSGDEHLLTLARAHPLVQALATASSDAVALDDLVTGVAGDGARSARAAWTQVVSVVIAMLGHVRVVAGRAALSVDTHLWVRELTRIDRAADTTARFRWGDDGPAAAREYGEETRPGFPAVYCRHCGRSGWGVGLEPVGLGLAADDQSIRRNHAQREGRFRALLHSPSEAESELRGAEQVDGLLWFDVRARALRDKRPAEDDPDLAGGWILPVLTTVGEEANEHAKDDHCPACDKADGIRFLGSAIATLLSVALSTLFGSGTLNPDEKKALVFTDSVQDAAHRAGFIRARSHALTLRGVLNGSVAGGLISLEELIDDVIRTAGDDAFARYRLLAPDCADRDSFAPFWQGTTARAVPARVRNRVRDRLALDAALEFGLNSRLGRTLELTGTVAVDVEAGQPAKMAAIARAAIESFAWQESTDGPPSDAVLVMWVRGVLDRMRTQGAIWHRWFEKYMKEDGNRWWLTGGRPRKDGMPAFPPGRPAPAYPRVGGGELRRDTSLDVVSSPKSWYAIWTKRTLKISALDGGKLTRLLLERLAREGILTVVTSKSNASVYALPTAAIVVAPTVADDLASGRHLLVCRICHSGTPGGQRTIDELDGAPCLVPRCSGALERAPLGAGFYRRLYASRDARRVVAREHSSLLDDKERLEYEDGFKRVGGDPQAPNVLVATPTLEMGIDIGDLSTVFLASLPRTVASYLQRVGRAGRLTGNALDLAFVTGRGEHLPKLGDPLSVIDGEVRPPATYLQAEEILRRQYVAHLADAFARDPARPKPRKASGAIGSAEPDTFLGDLIEYNDAAAAEHSVRFAATFGGLAGKVEALLADWTAPASGPGTSKLAASLHLASNRWQATIQQLRFRLDLLDELIPKLTEKANSKAAIEEDHRALRSAQAARGLTGGQLAHLQSEYWIGVLEEYGVLPNYTLLGDAVALDVGVSWIDPDDDTFHVEHGQITRGSARAIYEFAPGATFYGRGYEIEIDAIDLGIDGSAVRPWVFCPACGHGADVALGGTEATISTCPRCGSAGIADTGQRLDVVELTHVTAEVKRDEATINDRRDVRDTKPFQVIVAADVDRDEIGREWYTANTNFGCTYLRALDIRWLNLGTPGHGNTRTIAGEQRNGSLFRVCEGCGKRDIVAGRNEVYEHRPWCKFRAAAAEHNRTIALSRTLRTQGLLLRLPYSITLGDDFAVPSLSAAILLGLRELLGGNPDHLQVQRVVQPTKSDGSDNHDALLLHDIVPGGTGYLAEMAHPEYLHRLLATAWQRVRDCECQHEERLACHRCLLPFAAPSELRRVSRAAAERHLRALLGLETESDEPDVAAWEITDIPPPESAESQLEQRFRQLVLQRLKTAAAAVDEVPGAWGNTIRFTLPGQLRQWSLTPQVNVANSKPDFVLQSTDTNVPKVAIFTDGRAFHATEKHNKLADDAEKREILRQSGYVVLGLCAADLDDGAGEPAWFRGDHIATLITKPQFMAKPAAYQRLRKLPVDWLMEWVGDPLVDDLRTVAAAVPLLQHAPAAAVSVPDAMSPAEVARAVLLGETLAGPKQVRIVRYGSLVLAIEAVAVDASAPVIATALVLDDRPGQLDEAHADSWRLWLSLSNALALRDWPTVITTTTRVAAGGAPALAVAPVVPASLGLGAEWDAVVAVARPDGERELVLALAGHEGVVPPVVGEEGPDGIPLDLAWPDFKIAVDFGAMPATDRADLAQDEWLVLPADPDLIARELRSRAGSSA